MPLPINPTEVLVTPLATILREIAKSVADAQRSLDEHMLTTQKKIQSDEQNELRQIGYQPTWYHMPEINFELKMAMYYEESGSSKERKGFFFSPFNAKYQNNFNYKSEGTSTIKVRIVPVPPPLATEIK